MSYSPSRIGAMNEAWLCAPSVRVLMRVNGPWVRVRVRPIGHRVLHRLRAVQRAGRWGICLSVVVGPVADASVLILRARF